MPITITPAAPGGVGPGLLVQLNSNFVGPLPTGSFFELHITPVGLETAFVARGVQVTDRKTSEPQIGLPFEGWSWSWPGQGYLQPGQPCTVDVTLNEPGNVPVDSGQLQIPWDPTTGLPALLQQLQQGQGLTPDQAQQLQQIHEAVPAVTKVDDLGIVELTSGLPVAHFEVLLTEPFFGLIVRVSTIPEQLLPISADAGYWRTTLAQVSIFRAGDLWLRVPIHTSSRIIPLQGDEVASQIANFILLVKILNLHLEVTCFPGVTVRVFMMTLP